MATTLTVHTSRNVVEVASKALNSELLLAIVLSLAEECEGVSGGFPFPQSGASMDVRFPPHGLAFRFIILFPTTMLCGDNISAVWSEVR